MSHASVKTRTRLVVSGDCHLSLQSAERDESEQTAMEEPIDVEILFLADSLISSGSLRQ